MLAIVNHLGAVYFIQYEDSEQHFIDLKGSIVIVPPSFHRSAHYPQANYTIIIIKLFLKGLLNIVQIH